MLIPRRKTAEAREPSSKYDYLWGIAAAIAIAVVLPVGFRASETAAAWFQAVFSVAAIVGTFAVARSQQQAEERRRSEEETRRHEAVLDLVLKSYTQAKITKDRIFDMPESAYHTAFKRFQQFTAPTYVHVLDEIKIHDIPAGWLIEFVQYRVAFKRFASCVELHADALDNNLPSVVNEAKRKCGEAFQALSINGETFVHLPKR